jgi:hypothetical protein
MQKILLLYPYWLLLYHFYHMLYNANSTEPCLPCSGNWISLKLDIDGPLIMRGGMAEMANASIIYSRDTDSNLGIESKYFIFCLCQIWIHIWRVFFVLFSYLHHLLMLPSVSGKHKPLCIHPARWGDRRDCQLDGLCGKLKYTSYVTMYWVLELSCSVRVGFGQAQSSKLASVAGKFARCCHLIIFWTRQCHPSRLTSSRA